MKLCTPYLKKAMLIAICISPGFYLNAQDIPAATPNLQTASAGALVIELDNVAVIDAFTATKRVDGAAQLRWSTVTEKDNLTFFIEHSIDGINFTTVGEVAGRGDSEMGYDYDFLHEEMEKGINYYRLRIIATDDKQAYSETRKLVMGHKLHVLHIYPNPVMGKAYLLLDAKDGENVQVGLIDITGHELKKQKLVVKGQTAVLNLHDFEKGMYSVIVYRDSGEKLKGKLLVSF